MSFLKIETSTTFEESYLDFNSFCIAKNLSEYTIVAYRRVKEHLIKFMSGNFELSELTKEKVNEYIAYCKASGNNDISVNTKLRHIRAMYNFFAERGLCEPVQFKMLKTTKRIKETYTDEELKILLEKPNLKRSDFDDLRNWTVTSYLLATGNRLSTILNLKVGDINFSADEIILKHAKNRHQQIIPLGVAIRSVLLEYLRYRKPKSDEDYLFCTWHGEKLSNSGLINAIRKYNRSRGISKTSIHLYRNTFAKLWILNGGDIFRLQKLLNHKSIDMVREYVEMYGQDLKRDYDKFNPLSNIQQREHIKLKKGR